MTVRTTMADLILRTRSMTNAGTADYTIAGVSYWTDQQIQDVLDRNRMYNNYERMQSVYDYIAGGSIEYKRYESKYKNYEDTVTIQDGVGGSIAGSLYTENAMEGFVTFDADQAGSARHITGYVYNLNKAAAELWRKKAAHYASRFDFSTDNHSFKKSQLVAQALEMAKFYDSQGGIVIVEGWRDDVIC